MFEDGDTLPPETLPTNPLLQLYVEIVPLPAVALAASVVLCPLHIAAGDAAGASVGLLFTATLVEAVPEHPFRSVAVTVYEPFIKLDALLSVGDPLLLVKPFGPLQLYVFPPAILK